MHGLLWPEFLHLGMAVADEPEQALHDTDTTSNSVEKIGSGSTLKLSTCCLKWNTTPSKRGHLLNYWT